MMHILYFSFCIFMFKWNIYLLASLFLNLDPKIYKEVDLHIKTSWNTINLQNAKIFSLSLQAKLICDNHSSSGVT